MTKNEIYQVEHKLISFIARAAEKGATPEEIAALPGIAHALAEISRCVPNT